MFRAFGRITSEDALSESPEVFLLQETFLWCARLAAAGRVIPVFSTGVRFAGNTQKISWIPDTSDPAVRKQLSALSGFERGLARGVTAPISELRKKYRPEGLVLALCAAILRDMAEMAGRSAFTVSTDPGAYPYLNLAFSGHSFDPYQKDLLIARVLSRNADGTPVFPFPEFRLEEERGTPVLRSGEQWIGDLSVSELREIFSLTG